MDQAADEIIEQERLLELHATCLLDSPSDPLFDAVTRAVSTHLDVPIATVSLIDKDRQWFKSSVGLDVSETKRDDAFCAHVVDGRTPLLVSDATQDERFKSNPYVVGEPFIRSYAGYPIRSRHGGVLGALTAIGTQPRSFDEKAMRFLEEMANHVSSLVDMISDRTAIAENLRLISNEHKAMFLDVDPRGRVLWASERAGEWFGPERVDVGTELRHVFLQEDSYSELQESIGNNALVLGVHTTVVDRHGESQAMLLDVREIRRDGAWSSRQYRFVPLDEDTRRQRVLQKYADMFEGSSDLICTADMRYHFDVLNPAWERVLGWSLEELRARPFTEFVHPDDLEKTSEVAQQLVEEEGGVMGFVNRYLCKDGSYRSLSWAGAVRDGVFVASARDVTDQRRDRARIEFNNELLRVIAQAQVDFLTHGDSATWWTAVLDHIIAATGSEYGFIGSIGTDDEGVYLRTRAITDISWDANTREFYRTHAPAGLVFRNTETLFGRVLVEKKTIIANDVANDPRAGGRPPGHPPLNSFLGLACGTGANTVGMVGLANRRGGYSPELVSDLSLLGVFIESVLNQIKNQASRQEAQARLNAVIDSTLDAIITVSERGKIVSVNRAFEALFGYAEEAVGHDVGLILGPEYRDIIENYLTGAAPDTLGRGRQLTGVRNDGTTFQIDLTLTEFHLDGTRYFTGIISDATPRLEAERAQTEAAAKLSNALTMAKAGHWELDVRTDVVSFSEHFGQLFNSASNPVEVTELALEDFVMRFVHPEDRTLFTREVRLAGAGSDDDRSHQFEHRALRLDGTEAVVDVRYFATRSSTGVAKVHGLSQDVTTQVQRERELVLMEEQRRQNAELAEKVAELDRNRSLSILTSECVELVQRCVSLDEGTEVISRFFTKMYPTANLALFTRADETGGLSLKSSRVRFGNSAPRQMLGSQDCWALRTRRVYDAWVEGIHVRCPHDDEHDSFAVCMPLLSLDRTVAVMALAFERQTDLCRDESSRRGVLTQLESVAQSLSGALSSISLRESLQRLALVDDLTGLPNRRAFTNEAHRMLSRMRRSGEGFAIAMLDIDHFKRFNDKWGHDVGDRVLQRFARTLETYFRGGDVVGRFGGEEFAALLPGADREAIGRRLDTLCERVRKTPVDGVDDQPTVSIGYVFSSGHAGQTLDELLQLADKALYTAKSEGRNRVVAFTADLALAHGTEG